jgi:hypothetical protein
MTWLKEQFPFAFPLISPDGWVQQIIALSKLQYLQQWHVTAACMLNRESSYFKNYKAVNYLLNVCTLQVMFQQL